MKDWTYEEMLELCASGGYPSCPIVTAAGRASLLLGLGRSELAWIESTASSLGTGLILIGSRISGPRLRQRTLHPALEAALPLSATKREASAVEPGAEGVAIDKTRIKEYGRSDPRTSDLTVALISTREGTERRTLAEELERAFNRRGWSFPARVFAVWDGAVLKTEEDFRTAGETYLRTLAPEASFTSEQWRTALAELYLTVNL